MLKNAQGTQILWSQKTERDKFRHDGKHVWGTAGFSRGGDNGEKETMINNKKLNVLELEKLMMVAKEKKKRSG